MHLLVVRRLAVDVRKHDAQQQGERKDKQRRYDRLTVDPGDSVRFQALNSGWHWDSGEERFERDAKLHDGHALTGPIEVRGRLTWRRRNVLGVDASVFDDSGTLLAHADGSFVSRGSLEAAADRRNPLLSDR